GEDRIGFTAVTVAQATNAKGGAIHIERTREVALHEGASCLHQAYEDPQHECSIVVTLTAESRSVPELIRPSSGEPIVFRVALSHVTAAGTVQMETNVLRTLDGSAVSYGFKTERSS